MKRFIYLIGLFAVLALASCTETQEGAGDIKIGFATDKYSFKESTGLTKIKLDVTGEAKTYPVTFDIQAKLLTEDGAVLDDIIHFTQLEGMRIGGYDLAPVFVEFYCKDNDVINESRLIELSITNVNGAEVTLDKTIFEIRDNDNDPYDKLMGDWIAEAKDHLGQKITFPVNISGGFTNAEIEANDGKVLVCWGFGPYQREYPNNSPTKQPVWYMDFDEDAEKLFVQANTLMANVFSFTDLGYDVIVRCCGVEPGPKISVNRRLEGTWNETMDQITFEGNGYGLTAALFKTSGEFTDSAWLIYTDIVLTKKK